MNIIFEPEPPATICNTSRYLICMAAFVFRMSAAWCISFALSTSAAAEMIFAFDNLSVLETMDRLFCSSAFRLMSLIKICSTQMPHLLTFSYTQSSILSAISCLFSKRSCRVFSPVKVRRVAQVISATEAWMLERVQYATMGSMIRQQTQVSIFTVILSLVRMSCLSKSITLNHKNGQQCLQINFGDSLCAGVDLVEPG